MEIKREYYLQKLIDRMHNSLIKVIVGLRRSGKSYLLFSIFKNYLISIGIDESHIIQIILDDETFFSLRNREKLKKYIDGRIKDSKQYYLLIDEIQYVKNFEPILIKYMRMPNVDVYVTGSNSKFLSVDIDTSLNGKNDSIHIYPLSFKELKQVYADKYEAWNDYINYGGLPLTTQIKQRKDKEVYLLNLYKELYLKDILIRNHIKNTEEMEELTKILASSIGSFTNPNNIVKTIKSIKNKNIKWKTIVRYISSLAKAFFISEVERYDLKGRKYIGANKKYYFEDIGIRNAILNFKDNKIGHRLENIIFNELKYRGFNLNVGIVNHRIINANKIIDKQLEVDFIAISGNKQYAIQVATSISDDKVLEREIQPLTKIHNVDAKILLTTDNIPQYKTDEAITVMNVLDFLLDETILPR